MTTPKEAPPLPAAQSWMLDNPITRALTNRFMRQLDLRPGMRVLDVGCGPGRGRPDHGVKSGRATPRVSRRLCDRSTVGFELRMSSQWAGQESNLHSFRGGFTDRWARHVPFADP